MVNEKLAKSYCKEDISLIENYDKAIADTTQTWHCHHRDEVKVLASGITVIRSHKELKEIGRYYNCPANELIFLTQSEHSRLHNLNRSIDVIKKISNTLKGHSSPRKGVKLSEDTKKKLSESHKGNHKGTHLYNDGKINMRAYTCPEGFVKGKLNYGK